MADNENEETNPRGNEWEVVSLTESAYDAAPGSKEVGTGNIRDSSVRDDEAETSRAMFMSGHFVFPPSQHENLPIEPEHVEIHKEHRAQEGVPGTFLEDTGMLKAKDDKEVLKIKGSVSDDFSGNPIFDEEGNSISIGSRGFEGVNMQGLELMNKEQSIYDADINRSFHSETNFVESTTIIDDSSTTLEPIDHSDHELDSDLPELQKINDEDDDSYDRYGLPCEAWWKRRAASFYAHAKEANTLWSIFIAAAVMGLVILGHRWKQEKWQLLQLKWKIRSNDEKVGRMLGPISRFKDVIVGGHRKGRSSTSAHL